MQSHLWLKLIAVLMCLVMVAFGCAVPAQAEFVSAVTITAVCLAIASAAGLTFSASSSSILSNSIATRWDSWITTSGYSVEEDSVSFANGVFSVAKDTFNACTEFLQDFVSDYNLQEVGSAQIASLQSITLGGQNISIATVAEGLNIGEIWYSCSHYYFPSATMNLTLSNGNYIAYENNNGMCSVGIYYADGRQLMQSGAGDPSNYFLRYCFYKQGSSYFFMTAGNYVHPLPDNVSNWLSSALVADNVIATGTDIAVPSVTDVDTVYIDTSAVTAGQLDVVSASDAVITAAAEGVQVSSEISYDVPITDSNGVYGLQDVFPFCIPFDLYDTFANLQATREAPNMTIHFDSNLVPFVPDDWYYDMTIDLSDFDGVASILRTMELIGFVIALALASRKLIGAGG